MKYLNCHAACMNTSINVLEGQHPLLQALHCNYTRLYSNYQLSDYDGRSVNISFSKCY